MRNLDVLKNLKYVFVIFFILLKKVISCHKEKKKQPKLMFYLTVIE